jgi:5-methylcytosine-specific restriction endonuclease McrA
MGRMVTTKERGYGGLWPRVRLQILQRDKRICHVCGLPGADTVDHLEPISAAPHLRLDPRNLKAADRGCNARRAREREEREGFPNRSRWSVPRSGARQVWPGAIDVDL